jgi:3-oxoacyl-[acyl-carrier protein] reductase
LARIRARIGGIVAAILVGWEDALEAMTRISRLSRSIAGRVALVTGAASGMGRATAELFADEGARVAVTDLEQTAVDRVVAGIRAAGGVAAGYALDVSDPVRIRTIVELIAGELGPLDILVNNAGIAVGASLEQPDEVYERTWHRALEVMLTAHVRLVRACLPHLIRHGEGRVVNVASTEGLGATAGTGPYTAAKTGVIGLTRSLAVELGSRGVTVNCICPGPILTGMTANIPEAARAKFARRRVPLRRYGTPEEVAHAILSLVLPAASYLNGVVLPVDGGMTIQNS